MLIEAEPPTYRDEMADYLLDAFGVEVSLSTISRTLQREDISRKKVYTMSVCC